MCKKCYQTQEACMYVVGQERLQAMQKTQQYNMLPEGPIRRMRDPETPAMQPSHAMPEFAQQKPRQR